MGYDMHWRMKEPGEAEAVAAAREQWNAALAERDALPKEEAAGYSPETDGWAGGSDRWHVAQAKLEAASAAEGQAEQSYFRLNVWGMSSWTEIMAELGMVFDAGQYPEWPEIEAYGITWDHVEQAEYPEFFQDSPPLDAETGEKVRRFCAKRDEVLSWHGPEVPGIPVHKFGSNDGWIVLPAECEAALRIHDERVKELGQDGIANLVENKGGGRSIGRWLQWLAYLNGAVTHDGFEVH